MRYRYFIPLLILYFGCESKNQSDIQFEILAKVGDRIITREDYINRAEYTLAPASYLRRNPPDLEPEVAKLPPPEPLVYVPKVTYNLCRKDRNKRK